MTDSGKLMAAIFVDRASHQWVVRDPDGNFWSVPSHENPWDHRRPLVSREELDLEPVPGHYKNLLGVPF